MPSDRKSTAIIVVILDILALARRTHGFGSMVLWFGNFYDVVLEMIIRKGGLFDGKDNLIAKKNNLESHGSKFCFRFCSNR